MNKLKKDKESESNSETSSHQQQILFNEADLLMSDAQIILENTHDQNQIVFNNDDYIHVSEDTEWSTENSNTHDDILSAKPKKPRWLLRIISSLLLVAITIEMVDFFTVGFVQSPFVTSLYAIILAGVASLAGAAVLREFISLKQFKRREILKGQAQDLLQQNTLNGTMPQENKSLSKINDVESFCQKLSDNLPCDLVQEQEQAWQSILASEHSPAELMQLYSRVVLTKVDDKALAEVAKYSTEAVALVALSPIALLDMLIILVRNLKMINKIAGLYGLKLGYWSRIKLIKQVFVNMVYAGASELVADFGSEMIGADLLGKLSGRLAQGLGAGLLTSRLGIKTMELCRPIPFDGKPKLGQVRTKMLGTIKELLIKKK
jgi:putative membrane protein